MQQQDLNLFETQLDETAKAHLLETTRWTKFLGICSLIFTILLLLYFVFAGAFMGSIMGGGGAELGNAFGIIFIVIALFATGLSVYPIYALLKFSSCMKKGIQNNSQELINDGFRYQKTMYRYLGILTIIYLALILLSIVLSGISAL